MIVTSKDDDSGDGIINSTDAIAAEFIIEVPFEFIFTDDTSINIPVSELSEDSIPDRLKSMILYYQYKTPFNFNTYLSIYCSDDTTTIIDDSNKFIDFELLPSDNILTDSIEVSSNKFDLLSSSDFMKPIVNIISLTDENGDPAARRVWPGCRVSGADGRDCLQQADFPAQSLDRL